jgi:hypothetical protein
MTDVIEPMLAAQLGAWREASRQEPRRHARERALDAMLAAVTAGAAVPRARAPLFRPRFRHAGLLAATATLAATVAVAAAGWNAPPGSALFAVRAARQGVMLKLPGSNDADLHLQFAETSLAEAHDGVDPEQSLADARSELAAVLPELPADRASPLWSRYRTDQATLASEESELESEGRTPGPGVPTPRPTGDDTERGPTESSGGDDETPRSSQTGSPAPTDAGSDDGGGDDDHSGAPSPRGSPPPDN